MRGWGVATACGSIAGAVVVATAIIGWPRVQEAWLLHRLEYGDEVASRVAAIRLAEMRSRTAVELLAERTVQAHPEGINVLLPIEILPRAFPAKSRLTDENGLRDTWSFFHVKIGEKGMEEIFLEILGERTAPILTRVCIAQGLIQTTDRKKIIPLDQVYAAVDTFIEGLRSEDALTKAGALCGLAECGGEARIALPTLEGIAKDDGLCRHVMEAIRKIHGDPDPRPVDDEYRTKEELNVLLAIFRMALTDKERNPKAHRSPYPNY
jgi:hypothetical protein